MQNRLMKRPLKNMPVNRKLLIFILLIIATLTVYWKAGNLEFVKYDDPGYVVQNHHIIKGLSFENIYWAFTTIEMSNWHPLTWISYMIDGQMYGLNPRGFHLTNIFLHIANTLILFIFLNRATGAMWRSAFVAALFALHPLHVESVAWVSERKDVLSTLFFMLSLLAYVSYAERPRPARYLLVMLAFMLSLMSKPMLVTFPFILLLLDYWPLKRYQTVSPVSRLILDKIPFAVLSLASIIITIYAQYAGGSMASIERVNLILRIENAIVAYASYITKMLWPAKLVALYPISTQISIVQLSGAFLLLFLISLVAYRRRIQYPYIIVGWLWFLGTLVPVIGLLQVGSQSMADRYTYVPLIGLFIIVAWAGYSVIAHYHYVKKAGVVLACLITVIFSIVSWLQIDHWKNSIELFTHTLRYTSDNYVMHNNLGICLAEQGNYGEAIIEYEKALKISPHYKRSHYNLGNALLQIGDIKGSIQQYHEALRMDPDYLMARYNLGAALLYDGKYNEAISQYYEILKISPNFEDVHKLLGIQLACQGRIEEAIVQFSEILKYDPDAEDAHFDLSMLLASQGRIQEAIMHLSRALHKQPSDEIVANEVHKYKALAENRTTYEYLRNLLR